MGNKLIIIIIIILEKVIKTKRTKKKVSQGERKGRGLVGDS
jgi:hypothetical protein